MIEASSTPGVSTVIARTQMRDAGPRGRPMIAVKSIPELDEEKAQQENLAAAPYMPNESALAGYFRNEWQTNKINKNRVALRLLACLRARRGTYSQAEAAQIEQNGGGNIVWVDLTETKARAGAAWLREVLMPPQDLPFDLDPKPMPDLPPEVKNTIVQAAISQTQKKMVAAYQAAMQASAPTPQPGQVPGAPGPGPGGGGAPNTGGPPQGAASLPAAGGAMPPGPPGASPQGGAAPDVPTMEEFREMAREAGEAMKSKVEAQFMKAAKAAAERMRKQVATRMLSGGWQQAFDEFIEDFVTYPTAFIKGPFHQRGKRLKWAPGFIPTIDTSPMMSFKRVDPFDAYPAPWAQDCQIGTFIERVRFTRKVLYECIGVPGWKEQDIRAALRDYVNGHLEGWLWTEGERQRLQQDTMYTWLSPAGIIDALHCWGSVPGWMLMSWGVNDPRVSDPEQEYEVSAVLIGPYVVNCELNPNALGRRPYRNASFDAIPGAIWGRSIYDLGMTCQKFVNAAGCALADNMGQASGFQTWVHVDRLADGESSLEVFPGRVWQLKSDPTQGVNPGVGFFQPDSRAEELLGVIDKWTTYSDDATGIPRYTYGDSNVQGAAETYSGLAMLMNNAAKGLRRAISAVDLGVLEPMVWDIYIDEMLHNPDPSIKCDANVTPKGAVSILVKEAQSQARLQALQVTGANPIDLQIIGLKGRAEQLRQALRALEIPPDDIVPDDDTIERQQQAQMDAQQQQLMQQAQFQQTMAKQDAAFKQQQLDNQRAEINAKAETEGLKLAAQHAATTRADAVDFQYDDQNRIVGAVRKGAGGMGGQPGAGANGPAA